MNLEAEAEVEVLAEVEVEEENSGGAPMLVCELPDLLARMVGVAGVDARLAQQRVHTRVCTFMCTGGHVQVHVCMCFVHDRPGLHRQWVAVEDVVAL